MTNSATATGGNEAPRSRVDSIDLVRGAVMIVMVLDHVRDFFTDTRIDPTNLAVTTPALFFTRWITHFCAPTFALLAGVSASLSGARRARGELSRHLAIRGFWLIVVEQTLGQVFLFFAIPQLVLGLVLWALGWSMIALAGLIYLPRWGIAAIAVAMIAGHNAFDGFAPAGDVPGLVWGILHRQGIRVLPGGVPIFVAYPLIPWVGVMASGYALGPVFRWPARRRVRLLATLGLGLTAGFLALRAINVYGDPTRWARQPRPAFTLISFLNCQKYPPSLLYLMMTLGPVLLALAALDRGLGRRANPVRTIGRVPLFFYLLQWPVAHGLAVAYEAALGQPIGWMFGFPPPDPPPGYGHDLAVVYAAWAITVALLYGPCVWFAARTRRIGTPIEPTGASPPAT